MSLHNNQKRLLVVGASVLQLPAIQKAKELGFYVGVVDYNPKAIGIQYADEFFNVSTIDVDGVTEVTKSFHPDGIMTLATDMPMRAIAVASEACGLPGISYETAVKATDKAEMIKAFEEHGIEHPQFFVLTEGTVIEKLPDHIQFPVISKPTDNSGSRGIMLIRDESELREALSYSSRNGRSGDTIVEEYMKGPEASVEVMVIEGIPHVLQITDKLTTGSPHFVEIGHSQPSRLPKEAKKRIADLAGRAALAVGIKNGPAHAEIILTESGPKMVEIGARMGGGCITTHLVPLSTGIDMTKGTIDVSMGIKPDIKQRINKGSAIRFIIPPIGVVKDIKGVEEARQVDGIQEVVIECTIGQTLTELESGASRIGYVIAQADEPKQAVHICEQALSKIEILVD